MGWASGSDVMSGVISAVKTRVPDKEARVAIYRDIVNVLRDRDWDTMDECLGEDDAYDDIYNEMCSNED